MRTSQGMNMPKKVLIIGGGGRENKIARKLRQHHPELQIIFAPGNDGIRTRDKFECFNIKVTHTVALLTFALDNDIDFTIVGPEAPLAVGIVNLFQAHGLRIFGPTQGAAQIESSKRFAKWVLERANVPQAKYFATHNYEEAKQLLRDWAYDYPVVVKADGLFGGKGVVICKDYDSALKTLGEMFCTTKYGDAVKRGVVIEQYLEGEEFSVFVLADGKDHVILGDARDYKRLHEGASNSGGWGAFSPVPYLTPEVMQIIESTIIKPALEGLAAINRPYRGLLYLGGILTALGPFVLEFNCRFGDPETQAILARLRSDLLPLLLATTMDGELSKMTVELENLAAVCLVLGAAGYPDSPQLGAEIHGIEDEPDPRYLFAGVVEKDGKLYVGAGRPINVVEVGIGLLEAAQRAYRAAEQVSFEGAQIHVSVGAGY